MYYLSQSNTMTMRPDVRNHYCRRSGLHQTLNHHTGRYFEDAFQLVLRG
jgi:hypothetical protein